MAKIYIAGSVSGLPIEMVKTKFKNAENAFKNAGHVVVNPVEFIEQHNSLLVKSGGKALTDDCPKSRKMILKICFNLLMDCDYIHLLHDWQESDGAQKEYVLADMLNIETITI